VRPQPDPPRVRKWKCRQVYHVYQRGSQRQSTFIRPADSILYLDRLDVLARRYKVRIHAFCLMSNHVHFMLEPLRRGAISRLMQFLQSQHARYINGLNHTAGHLWHHHFHAKLIKNRSQYCETLLYIERNPVVGNPYKHAHLYAYSSAAAHAANQPLVTITHKRHRAQVKLYLDRWRKEFEFPETGSVDWPAWLRSPRNATHARDVASLMGKTRNHPQSIPPASANSCAIVVRAATARGS